MTSTLEPPEISAEVACGDADERESWSLWDPALPESFLFLNTTESRKTSVS